MTTVATAAVLKGHQDGYSLTEVLLDDPRPGELIVKIAAVGHCHTDVLPRIAELGLPLPIIPGHEGAGEVLAVGAGVTTVAAGDHVLLTYDTCGRCRACRRAQPYGCEWFGLLNMTGQPLDGIARASAVADGAAIGNRWFGQSSFATHSLVSERQVVKVDSSLPLEVLAPLGCGIQTGAGSVFNVLRPGPGDAVAVWGVGAVGMASVMAAVVAGAATIVAVDLNPARLELAKELGATHCFDGSDPEVVAQVLNATAGGVDASLDTTGVPIVIERAIAATRAPGTIGLVGVQQGDVTVGPMTLSLGKRLVGIIEGSARPADLLPRLISLWQAGRFPLDRLVVPYALSDIDRAEADAMAGRVIKPVLVP